VREDFVSHIQIVTKVGINDWNVRECEERSTWMRLSALFLL